MKLFRQQNGGKNGEINCLIMIHPTILHGILKSQSICKFYSIAG